MKNKLSLNKKFILLSFLSPVAIDFVAIVLLLLSGISFNYLIYPLVFLINDLVFLYCFYESNPRFKYTLKEHMIFEIISVVFLFIISLMFFISGTQRMMTSTGWLLFFFSRIIIYGLTGRVLKLSRNDEYHIDKNKIKLSLAISYFVGVLYIGFILATGFYGQGNFKRNIIYSYNSSTKSYVVSDVTGGKSHEVKIPSKFNSKPVTTLSLKVLTDEHITRVVIENRDTSLKLTSFNLISEINKDLKIYASPNTIDSIRNSILNELSVSNDKANNNTYITLINSLMPNGDSNEIYISYKFNEQFLNLNTKYLESIKLFKGDILYLESILDNDLYLNRDFENQNNLKWCFENNKGYMLKDIKDSNGLSLIGKPINESMYDATIEFEKVYMVTFETGNMTSKSSVKETAYVTKSSADSFIKRMEDEGFRIVSVDIKSENKTETVESLSNYLAEDKEFNTFTIIPEYEMLAPDIISINPEVDENDKLTVSKNTIITVEAIAKSSDFNITYEWYYSEFKNFKKEQATLLSEDDSLSVSYAGYYTIVVKSQTQSKKSTLKSETAYTIYVEINK